MISTMREQHTSGRDGTRLDVTYEHVLWVLVAAIALVLRVAKLGDAPLTATEAREALLAWRAASGAGMPLMDYNPVLFAVNSLLFTLFGSSDAVVRLIPALSGVGLTLSPVLLRRYLGRVPALASAAYLALSPTAIVASRELGGSTLASAAAIACAAALLHFSETESRSWLSLAAVALALSVTGGAAAYGVLLPLGVAWAVVSRRGADGLPTVEELVHPLRQWAPQFLLTFGIAVLLLSTGFGWNMPGLSASGDLLVRWLGRFQRVSPASASPLTLLVVYEILASVFAIGGAIVGLRRDRPLTALLVVWAGIALLLLLLMPGHKPTDILWIVLPLAMLVGVAVEAIVEGLPEASALSGTHVAIVLVLWAYAYLTLGRYAVRGDPAAMVLTLVVLLLQVLVGVIMALGLGWRGTMQSAATGTGVALLALTLSTGWGIAYERPADAREPLLLAPTPPNVADLVQTLEQISWRETGTAREVPFVYEAPDDSVLTWYLRVFGNGQRVDALQDLPGAKVGDIIVTMGREATMPTEFEGTYAGQDFALRWRWTPHSVACRLREPGCEMALRWYLFRTTRELPAFDQWATLWRSSGLSYSQ